MRTMIVLLALSASFSANAGLPYRFNVKTTTCTDGVKTVSVKNDGQNYEINANGREILATPAIDSKPEGVVLEISDLKIMIARDVKEYATEVTLDGETTTMKCVTKNAFIGYKSKN